MRRFTFFLVALCLFSVSACQKAPELTVTSPSSIELGVDGSSSTITFTANRDWSVRSSDSWVSVSPSSGAASDETVTVRINCSANTSYEDRTATITITMEEQSRTVTVRQPANLDVIVPTKSYDLTSDVKSIEVEVKSNVLYSVSISDNWIKHVGTKALITDKLTFSIDENTTYECRSATITIKPQNAAVPEQVIRVKQAANEEGIVAVDLGLSVKWSALNLGASKPWEYGDYYAWGETVTKENYVFENYKFRSGGDTYSDAKFSKYNTDDNKIVLDPEDDVAHVVLGGNWRMPTHEEWRELINNCTWTWSELNGVKGFIMESKSNGNSIFLPAAGGWDKSGFSSLGSMCRFWSSSSLVGAPRGAYCVDFSPKGLGSGGTYRYYGRSIRPVSE